jgi:sugar lactone lactonase YvrE
MVYGGLGGVLQTLFGRIYFPNSLEPVWMIEGLAVYEESEQTSGGRNRSPGAEMVIRTAVLEDRFPPLSNAAVFPDVWPEGQVPYLFGGAFTRFIAEKYGREKLAEISTTYSGRGFPFLVDSTGERVLKQEYGHLWDEWLESLRTRYARLRDELIAKGLTTSLALTKRGYQNGFPAFSPDGTRFAYAVENADEFPAIYVMNSDGTGDRKLVENTTSSSASGQSLAWSPDGTRIYYTKFDFQRNVNLYNDIYYYDLKRGEEVRVTRGLRARDPHPSPDGKKLLFVTSKLGRTRLALLDVPKDRERRPAREEDITYITEESENLYETPRFSPDGTRIVAGVRQPGGYKDIWILDSAGNKIEELMHDRASDGGAAWSPDGKAVYFASDRTGIFNLFACELETKKIYQITNVLSGAFAPAPSPDGKTLVFSSYSAKGFDIRMRPADSASWREVLPYTDPYPVVTYADNPVETQKSGYNPLPTLLPRFWLPWFGYSSESSALFGFLTMGQDAIQRHSYSLSALYSPKTYRTWYSFDYVYDGMDPTLRLSASDVDDTFSELLTDPTNSADYVQRDRTLDVALVFPLFELQRQHALVVGYRHKQISALTHLPPSTPYIGPVPAQGSLVSGRAQYLFNNARQYGNSISPDGGRLVVLGYEQLDRQIGSDFNISKYTADWHEYLSLPLKHHVLHARAFAGASSGDPFPQGAFSLGGDTALGNVLDSPLPIDAETVFLRGYPANAFRGRKAALASLEYRFPIASINAGPGNKPIFFRRVHGAVFAETGNAWDAGFHGSDFKNSVGTEGRLDMFLAYYVPVTLRIGIAAGLDEKRETTLIFGLWAPLLF